MADKITYAERARQESFQFRPSDPAPKPDWMTRKEVAEYGRVTEDTVTALADKGDLVAYRFGGQLRYKRADVDAAFKLVAPKANGKNGAK